MSRRRLRRREATGFAAGLLVAGIVALVVVVASSAASGPRRTAASPATPGPAATSSSASAPLPQATGSSGPAAPLPVAAVVCPRVTVAVHDAAGLTTALAAARPGTVIGLADGTYDGTFTATAKGTADAPVYMCGGRRAVLDGGTTKSGYVLHLSGASFWRVSGFRVQDGQKGIVADHTTSSVLDDLEIADVGDEGIHLRAFSTGNSVQNDDVHDTGSHSAKYGEGIYVGSATSNWCTYSSCGPDRSDHNLVADNTVTRTTAENLDIKEGTTGGVVRANSFDGTGMTAADSWVDVKGDGWVVAQNTGTGDGTGSLRDGFQTHQILTGWGTGNVFEDNTAHLDAAGYGFHLTPVLANQVGCDNTVTAAGQGTSNVSCTRTPAPSTSPGPGLEAASTRSSHHGRHHTS